MIPHNLRLAILTIGLIVTALGFSVILLCVPSVFTLPHHILIPLGATCCLVGSITGISRRRPTRIRRGAELPSTPPNHRMARPNDRTHQQGHRPLGDGERTRSMNRSQNQPAGQPI
jgi:hypothetical protein